MTDGDVAIQLLCLDPQTRGLPVQSHAGWQSTSMVQKGTNAKGDHQTAWDRKKAGRMSTADPAANVRPRFFHPSPPSTTRLSLSFVPGAEDGDTKGAEDGPKQTAHGQVNTWESWNAYGDSEAHAARARFYGHLHTEREGPPNGEMSGMLSWKSEVVLQQIVGSQSQPGKGRNAEIPKRSAVLECLLNCGLPVKKVTVL